MYVQACPAENLADVAQAQPPHTSIHIHTQSGASVDRALIKGHNVTSRANPFTEKRGGLLQTDQHCHKSERKPQTSSDHPVPDPLLYQTCAEDLARVLPSHPDTSCVMKAFHRWQMIMFCSFQFAGVMLRDANRAGTRAGTV